MPDPVTMTASAIAALTFQEFVKSGAGELAKKFTTEAIAKMGQLRDLVWNRLTGKHAIAEEALARASAGEQEGIDTVATLLGVEMLDKAFAEQVNVIAREITQLIDNHGGMNQTNFGGTNFQTKVDGGEVYQASIINIHKT
jgi:hypothetical protein